MGLRLSPVQVLGVEILSWLDAKSQDDREKFQVINSLIAAGADPYEVLPERYRPKEKVVQGAQEDIGNPEAALDLSEVRWEVPTEEELAQAQQLLMEMAGQRAGGDESREWV